MIEDMFPASKVGLLLLHSNLTSKITVDQSFFENRNFVFVNPTTGTHVQGVVKEIRVDSTNDSSLDKSGFNFFVAPRFRLISSTGVDYPMELCKIEYDKEEVKKMKMIRN
jgi:hypothetical protein